MMITYWRLKAASKKLFVKSTLTTMLCLFGSVSFAQNNDQLISISFDGIPLTNALAQLDKSTERQLSYNPQILPSDQSVNGEYNAVTTEYVLQELLGNAYDFKHIGDYIIIQKVLKNKVSKKAFEIKGAVIDAQTGAKLDNVSVYEVNSLQSTLTDNAGGFNLSTESRTETATFAISRINYKDTIIQLSTISQYEGAIVLMPERKNETERFRGYRGTITERASNVSKSMVRFFTSKVVRTNARNIRMRDTRYVQLSLVPAIGTNMKLSSQITNRISFNMIAGYAYGVEGLEMGGFYNITRARMSGVQLGGFGNTVGGEVTGLQMAGFVNSTADYVNGAQIAGFLNQASDSVRGFQMGGFLNVTAAMKGTQIAGFSNHTRNMDGWQVAGAINTAKNLKGPQISGFLNVAKIVNGLQLGVINIADSVDSGVQIGVINIVKKNGLLSPAFESDGTIPYRVSLRTGLDRFYSVLSVGINPDPDQYWSIGTGFGSRIFIGSKGLFFNPEFRGYNLYTSDLGKIDTFYLNKLHFNIGFKLLQGGLSVVAGPSLNAYVTNQFNEDGSPVIDIAKNPFYDSIGDKNRYQMWVDYTVGIWF